MRWDYYEPEEEEDLDLEEFEDWLDRWNKIQYDNQP